MSRLQSRKFFAFIVWIMFMLGILLFHKEAVVPALPWFGGVTMIYVSVQAIIDIVVAIVPIVNAWKGRKDE